jgi:hypothetical protein
MEAVFIALQIFILAFLVLHDWIPLGPFNDVLGVRSQHTLGQLVLETLINSVPIAVTLDLSIRYYHVPYPYWVKVTLVAVLGLLFVGELRAWWIPYLVGTDPGRVTRYAAMFGKTHAFLPPRHGITPNTAHVALHIATFVALVLALRLSFVK